MNTEGPVDSEAALIEAKRHMKEGITLLDAGEYAASLAHFDVAAGLRAKLPWKDNGEYAWLAAAAWINRSDAIRGLGEPGRLPEAIECLDLAIEAMAHVPLGNDTSFVERLILSWINRGTACGEASSGDEALRSFLEAERVCEEWGEDKTPRRIFLTAMLRVNRARVLLALRKNEESWLDSREAVRRLKKLELSKEVASAGVKARSIQCRALAMLLDEPEGLAKVGDWIAEATDSAEEALALVRSAGFRDVWVSDLVRYGAKIYLACQPHFLGEFVAEWLGNQGPLADDTVLKAEMRSQLWLAIAHAERDVLQSPQDTEFVQSRISLVGKLQSALAEIGG